jgi:DNA-binding NtrC family response regulator
MACVLIIASTPPAASSLQARLAGAVKLEVARSLAAAQEKLARHKFNLVIWCAAGPAAGNFGDFENAPAQIAAIGRRTKLVVLTSEESRLKLVPDCVNVAVEQEPADEKAWQQFIERFLACQSRRNSRSPRPATLDVPIEFEGMIAVSLPMRAVVRRALEAVNVDIPVLITGETGTGKDLLACGIHRRSQRRDKPFIAINTGAMPPELIASEIFGHERGAYTGAQECRPGIFEQAQDGTVFLDEIATMDAKTQISLLRVLEEKSFRRVGGNKTISANVRIIAAANEDLEKSVAEKRFREDLFYRLNVFHIAVPALRDRPGAVTVLTDHFVALFAKIYEKEIDRVSPETYRLLRHYPWPGNVRELKNVIQTAVLLADSREVTPELVPHRIKNLSERGGRSDEAPCSTLVGQTLGAVEKEFIELTLASLKGNKKQAASVLGISRRALYNKMHRHQLA